METDHRDVPGLLEKARAGEAEAFGEICRGVETRLLRQAVSLCGDLDLAEDLAQETLVEAWRYLNRFNGRCQFFTWLCAILLNRYRNVLREKRPALLANLAVLEPEAHPGWPNSSQKPEIIPDKALQIRERALLVRECIQSLSPKHQQVIYLRFYVDDSLESIGEALGCSVGTVKSRLFHALEKLRAMKALGH